MSDKILYELTKEIRDELKDHTKADTDNFKEITETLHEHTGILSDIRKDLNAHMEGVIQNRGNIKVNATKIEELEAPKEARKYIKEWLIGSSKVAGAILGLLTLVKFLGPYLKQFLE